MRVARTCQLGPSTSSHRLAAQRHPRLPQSALDYPTGLPFTAALTALVLDSGCHYRLGMSSQAGSGHIHAVSEHHLTPTMRWVAYPTSPPQRDTNSADQ